MSSTLGLKSTSDFITNQEPENWREGLALEYPNGDAPLTALTSMMKSEKTDSSTFHWWTKTLPTQGGAVTSVWNTAGLADEYVYADDQTTNGVAGATVYCQCAAAVTAEFRVGHQVLLRDNSRSDVDVVGKVVGVVSNTTSSYVAVRLLEDDDNSAASDTYNLATVDYMLVIGNINEEGANTPQALAYDPTEYENYVQIMRTAFDLTNTADLTRLRTGSEYKENKREAMLLHGIEMEKNYLWGVKTSNTGAGGKPERTTDGLITALRTNAAANVADFTLQAGTDYSGKTWLSAGELFLDNYLEQIFRYGDDEKLVFAGSGAILGINQIAKASGQIQLQPTTVAYGLKVLQWITPFGVIYLKRHPLFSYDSVTRNSMLVFEPRRLKYRFMRDTKLLKDRQDPGADRKTDELLTEAGLEFHMLAGMGYLMGIGSDNNVT